MGRNKYTLEDSTVVLTKKEIRHALKVVKDHNREALDEVLRTIEVITTISKDKAEFNKLMSEKYGQKEMPFRELFNTNVKKLSKFNQSLKTVLEYNPKKEKGKLIH
jgi:hypothetical protein